MKKNLWGNFFYFLLWSFLKVNLGQFIFSNGNADSSVNLLKPIDIMMIRLLTLFNEGERLSTQNVCLFVGWDHYSDAG